MALVAVYVSADVSDSASPALQVSTRERKRWQERKWRVRISSCSHPFRLQVDILQTH